MKEKTGTPDSTVALLVASVAGALAALAAFALYIVKKTKSIVNEDDKPQ